MTSKECEEQLNSLIEHFNNGGLDFNATDIEAIKHLMLENQTQHNKINELYKMLKLDKEKIDYWVNVFEELENWLKNYLKLMDNPDVIESGQIDILNEVLDKIQEIKEGKNE